MFRRRLDYDKIDAAGWTIEEKRQGTARERIKELLDKGFFSFLGIFND